MKGRTREPDDFASWSDRAERRIVRAIKTLVALLLIAQLIMQIPAVRHKLATADEPEGIAYRQSRR